MRIYTWCTIELEVQCMKTIYVDIGSSTVKVYDLAGKGLCLQGTKSFHFKDGFTVESGLTPENTDGLLSYIRTVQKKYKGYKIKVFATAIFRKMNPDVRRKFADNFFDKTGLLFHIVPHDLEGHYLEQALSSAYEHDAPLLLINIGGGSTELVVKESGIVKERYNLEIGVGTVLSKFPGINKDLSDTSLEEVVADIIEQLPKEVTPCPVAIYNGGELTYMQLAGYDLQPNDLFSDVQHPLFITSEDFAEKNKDVFSKMNLGDLESLMPDDPLWMHGARPCSAIAQAIVERFNVQKIVPSDSNMTHGIAKQEHRSVVLSGSFRKHLDYILDVKRKLTANGAIVLSPRFEEPKNPGEEFVVFSGEEGMSPLELERYHLDMIDQADALIVCAAGGYVGASALIEIGYAQALGKRIIFTEKPEEFMLQTLPAEIGL